MTEHNFSKSLSNYVGDGNWIEIENFFNNTEYAKHLGINVVLNDPSNPVCEINDIKAFHLGGVGQNYINGAVISGVFDLVIGLTALGYASLGNLATTNVNIQFLKPVANKRFYITAKINREVGKRVFAEATLYNYRDEPCGYATGEIRVGIS